MLMIIYKAGEDFSFSFSLCLYLYVLVVVLVLVLLLVTECYWPRTPIVGERRARAAAARCILSFLLCLKQESS